MARGWGSKSAETRADRAEIRHSAVMDNSPDPEKLKLMYKKESILLSRTRVLKELQNAQNPRYKALMTKALADLDAQLSILAAD